MHFLLVKVIVLWNEVNYFMQLMLCNLKVVVKFIDIVVKVCLNCTFVVVDMLDQVDDPLVKKLIFKLIEKFIKTFCGVLKTKCTVCGIHNYSDVNCFCMIGMKVFEKVFGCKQYWLMEIGGLYKFGFFWFKKTYHGCKLVLSC